MTILTPLGFVLIALSLYQQHVAETQILNEWRKADPRAWAGKMRAARRVFPFSLIVRGRVLENDKREWMMRDPEWAHDSLTARRWLRRYRWWLLLLPVGVMVAIVPPLLRG